MAPSRRAVPGSLYSVDPSERASGFRQIGRLERKRAWEWCVYTATRDPGREWGQGYDVHLGFSLFLLFASVHYLRFVACPETKERSERGYQPHGCPTPKLTLRKKNSEKHTPYSPAKALSLVLVGSQVTFPAPRVRMSLFVSLLSNHPTLHVLQGSSLYVVSFTISVL